MVLGLDGRKGREEEQEEQDGRGRVAYFEGVGSTG